LKGFAPSRNALADMLNAAPPMQTLALHVAGAAAAAA